MNSEQATRDCDPERIIALAESVFADRVKAQAWLHERDERLDASRDGCWKVETLLIQIDEGIYN